MMADYAYLYCFALKGAKVAKVGVTARPNERISVFQTSVPFNFEIKRLLLLDGRKVADAWESHILTHGASIRGRGEWLQANDILDDLLDEVVPAVDVTEEFCTHGGRIIPPRTVEETMGKVYRETALRRMGGSCDEDLPNTMTRTAAAKAVIRKRIADGYGAEDVKVMDGYDPSLYWRVVEELRERRALVRNAS